MTGYNPDNERVKKQYEEALLHGRHREQRTVDAAWRAINLFEEFTGQDNFKNFRAEQAKAFKGIDAALAKSPSISSAQMSEVKKLRDEGNALHKSGKHGASLEALHKAMGILGIKH